MATTTEQRNPGGVRMRESSGGGGEAVRGSMDRPRHLMTEGRQEAEGLANALAWFTIGLGVAEIVAPRRLSELIGIRTSRKNRAVMQAMGIREVVKGVGILSRDQPRDWMWGRVAGDMLDLGLLGRALAAHSEKPQRTTAAIGAVLGVTAADVLAAQALSAGKKVTRTLTAEGDLRVRKTVSVMKPVGAVYRFWADFENFPRFMAHLEDVTVVGEGRTRWTMRGPAGSTIHWEVEITEQQENEVIAWRSAEGAPISTSGSVRFRTAPGDRGTEVTLEVEYDPPLGQLGATLAKLFREEPGQVVRDDLRRFKQVIEVGEVLLSDATVRRGPRPARPPEHFEMPPDHVRVEKSSPATPGVS